MQWIWAPDSHPIWIGRSRKDPPRSQKPYVPLMFPWFEAKGWVPAQQRSGKYNSIGVNWFGPQIRAPDSSVSVNGILGGPPGGRRDLKMTSKWAQTLIKPYVSGQIHAKRGSRTFFLYKPFFCTYKKVVHIGIYRPYIKLYTPYMSIYSAYIGVCRAYVVQAYNMPTYAYVGSI